MDVSRVSREKSLVSNDICGTCLRVNDLIDITEEDYEETPILTLLEKYVTPDFYPTPKCICRICADEFISINRFIEKCKRSVLLSASFKEGKEATEGDCLEQGLDNEEEAIVEKCKGQECIQPIDNIVGTGWKKDNAIKKTSNDDVNKSGRKNILKKIDRNEEKLKYKNKTQTLKQSNQKKFSLKPLNTYRLNKNNNDDDGLKASFTFTTENINKSKDYDESVQADKKLKFRSKQSKGGNQKLQEIKPNKPKFIKSIKPVNSVVEVIETKREIIEETQNVLTETGSKKKLSIDERRKTTQDWLIKSVHKKTTTQLKSNNLEACITEDFRRTSSSSEEDGNIKGRRVTSTSTYRSDDVDDFDRLSIAKSDINLDTSRPGYEYKCDHCPCSFMLVSSLAHHRKVHGITIISKPYLCEYCGETFMNFSKFRTHRKDHSLEQPYMCLYCEKIVRGPLIHSNHIRYHTMELGEISVAGKLDAIEKLKTRGKFVCALCGKLFGSEDLLQTHLFWHPDESQLFGCNYCDKTFTQKRSLRNHEYLHKGEKKDEGNKGKPNTC